MRAMEISPNRFGLRPSVPPVASAPPVVVPPVRPRTAPYIPEQAALPPSNRPMCPPVAGYTPYSGYTPAPPYPPHLSVYGQPLTPRPIRRAIRPLLLSAHPAAPQVPLLRPGPEQAVSVQTPQFPTFPAGATSQSPLQTAIWICSCRCLGCIGGNRRAKRKSGTFLISGRARSSA